MRLVTSGSLLSVFSLNKFKQQPLDIPKDLDN